MATLEEIRTKRREVVNAGGTMLFRLRPILVAARTGARNGLRNTWYGVKHEIRINFPWLMHDLSKHLKGIFAREESPCKHTLASSYSCATIQPDGRKSIPCPCACHVMATNAAELVRRKVTAEAAASFIRMDEAQRGTNAEVLSD